MRGGAATLDERVAQIRLIPQRHGTGEHPAIYAAVAREAYVPHLAPDFAYIYEAPFYERELVQQPHGPLWVSVQAGCVRILPFQPGHR